MKSLREKKPSLAFTKIDVTFAEENLEKGSSFTISGIIRTELCTQMKTIMKEYMMKYGLTQTNFSSYVPNATMHSKNLRDIKKINLGGS